MRSVEGAAIAGLGIAAAALAYVGSGRRSTEDAVLRLIRLALWAALVGGISAWAEIAAVADRAGASWVAVAADGRAAGGVLRLVAAALLVVGLFDEPVLAGDAAATRWVAAGAGAIAPAGVVVGMVAFAVG